MDLSKFVEQKKIEKEVAEQQKKAAREAKRKTEQEQVSGIYEDIDKQEAEKQRIVLEEIRNKIRALEQEKKEILDSLAGWKTGQEEMRTAAKAVKERHEKIKGVVEEGKEFFAEKGIESAKDVLKSEEFAEAREVKSYKEAENTLLEKVAELKKHRRKATGQERGHLSKAEKESAKKIEKINKEIEELHEQTPEGQHELKERAKKDILERHEKLNHWVLYDYNGLRSTNFVEQKDLKLIPKIGEGLVKDTILKHYLGQLEDQLNRKSVDVLAFKRPEKAGEAVTAKFERDWNQAKLQELDQEKKAYGVAQKKKEIDIGKENAQKALSQLPELRLNFKDKLEETVRVGFSKHGRTLQEKIYVDWAEQKLKGQRLDEETKTLRGSLDLQKKKIDFKRANEPRVFGKAKHLAELEELEQGQYDLEQKIEKASKDAREAYGSVLNLERGLAGILALSSAISEDLQGERTAKELLDLIEKKAKEDSEARLSPTEENIYKKRVELEKAIEEALKKIRKIYPNY